MTSRGMTRAGVLKLSRSLEGALVEFAELPTEVSEAAAKVKAEDFLGVWELQALDVYQRHELPCKPGVYVQRAGQEGWEHFDPLCPPAGLDEYWSGAQVHTFGSEADPDSELGFAFAILEKIARARGLLQSPNASPWEAFAMAASIAQTSEALQIEFGLKDWLGPGRVQADGRRAGGKTRAAEVASATETRRTCWLKLDQELPARLSKTARANLIAGQVATTDMKASGNTIRKVLGSKPI